MRGDHAAVNVALSKLPCASSIWETVARPSTSYDKLTQDVVTDIVVIGAGITGLNAAWELSKRGVACVVLDANDAGWGASGRNGGMAVLRYKKAWSVLARELGDGETLHLYRLICEAVDTLEQNVQELGLACDFQRCGHITAANGPRAVAMLAADCRWLVRCADDSVPRMLDAREAEQLIGSGAYYGGYLDVRSAGIQPLDYSRGFAAALKSRHVPIYSATPAQELIVNADGAIVTTPGGEVRARKVLICSNAYTELQPIAQDLARRFVPVSTSVVATSPLPEALLKLVLPQRHLVTDTRHLVNYFRRVPGDRLLFGGRGSLTGGEQPGIYDGLIASLRRTFPQLADVPIDHRWSGKVAVTLDDFPHLGALGDRVLFALGYGGRGVALANLLGRHLALHALGEHASLGPMTEARFRPIPFHGLRIPAMNVIATYYKLRDRLRV